MKKKAVIKGRGGAKAKALATKMDAVDKIIQSVGLGLVALGSQHEEETKAIKNLQDRNRSEAKALEQADKIHQNEGSIIAKTRKEALRLMAAKRKANKKNP